MTWTALAFAVVSALVAIAAAIVAAIVAYLGRPLQEISSRPGLNSLGNYRTATLTLTLLAPFFAAVSAGLSAVAVLANS